MFNDFWMAEQGFIQRQPQGDLSDLITHRYEKGEVITVGPSDSLLTAYKRMRDSDVSQLPVVDQSGRAVGLIDPLLARSSSLFLGREKPCPVPL